MISRVILFASTIFISSLLPAQEGPVATQSIVGVDSKSFQPLRAQNIKIKVNGLDAPISAISPVKPNGTQIVLLIDDGLRDSIGRQFSDIQGFIRALPQGTEVLIGYMQNGRVVSGQGLTTDHDSVAKDLRLPMGPPGASASPYFCLSDFLKHWPGGSGSEGSLTVPKARFVMMLTNGVDPYNGSVSPLNQNSVYVDSAIRDAQSAGVTVSSIYYGNSGIRGGAASFSGQSYLAEVADETGGHAYFQGTGNPVSLSPFFDQFRKSIAESFVATFLASSRNNELADVKFSTSLPSTKLVAPRKVRLGTRVTPLTEDQQQGIGGR
jgi:hypothetical protein